MLCRRLASFTCTMALFLAGCGPDAAEPTRPIVEEPPGQPPKEPPEEPPEEPPVGTPDPWPKDDVRHYGPGAGIPGRIVGVAFDDAKNVYAIDGAAAYAMRVGTESFVRTATGGQFERGHPVASIAGGNEGEVHLGFLAPENGNVETWTEEDKKMGDVDRMKLQPDGTLVLDRHFQIQNSNAKWMDETRSILTMKRVVGGPFHGDVYLGSNHGATVLRQDEWADHRHPVFHDESGSLAIGYVHAVNVDKDSNFIFGAYWMLAAVGPAPLDDLERWTSIPSHPWLVYTWPEHLGRLEEPKDIRSIAGDLSRRKIFVGTFGLGLSEMTISPRSWRSVPETPDSHILGLEWETEEEKLWVATLHRGLWRWDTSSEEWEQSPFVPTDAAVFQILLDETVTPRALYAATDRGLYVIRAP